MSHPIDCYYCTQAGRIASDLLSQHTAWCNTKQRSVRINNSAAPAPCKHYARANAREVARRTVVAA